MADLRTLSTREAGRLLGGVSRSTMRRRAETGDLPAGWRADKEHRPQGDRWVIYVPIDDPRLARLAASVAVPGTSQGPPGDPRDVPDRPPIGPPGDGPYQEPRLSIPEVRDALIAPLVARLAETDRQLAARYELIGQLRETSGRDHVRLEVADQKVALLEAEIASARQAVTELQHTRDRTQADLRQMSDHLAAALGDAGGLKLALQASHALADELRQVIAIERDARLVAEARLRGRLGWRAWRWVVALLGDPST